MKKTGVLTVLLVLLLSGCSNGNVPRIEDYDWVMTSVQSVEADGQVVFYGERASSTLDSARQIELICRVEDNGAMTIIDETNHKTCTGTYEWKRTGPMAANYEVVVDGKKGLAVVSMTTYNDGSQIPTFIMSFDEYVVNFFPA